ncbi:MAG: hypothetical protein M0R17_05995 [Candidatus Omnitrophica bacterium]|jgi:hypothetical protein|nr:hypothetical protein [Candidatus Omnitrophota bacterium]
MGKEEKVNLKVLDIGVLKLKIVGTSPYMPEPMDMEVLEKYNKIKSKQNYKKDDISEEEKVKVKYYYTDDGKYGIPARAFYNAMIRASSYLFDIKQGGMRNVKEGVTIKGDIIPIEFKEQKVLTHWGRTSGMKKSPMKIMRNAFYDWSVELEIEYNKENLSAEQIVNVLNWAGFHIGVGSFRKEKTGNFGLFRVNF